jgi:type I restriction enzyme S subunit
MIEGLQPYSEYRDSKAPWFGNVPSHWEVKRLGSLFGERGETNDRREVTDILSVLKDRGVIPYAEKGRIGNKASDDIGRYKIVRPDDLVVNCMNVIIGSLGRSRYTGCLSPVYYVLRRRNPKNDPRYLELLFQHRPFHQSLIRIGNGILAHRMRIPMEKLKAEMLPLPPPDEQAAIVRFLDYANRKIDGFVQAKRKLIGLLNEQKQAIIHQAVTRGRNPDVPLKPSGISWLGDIPQHWEVKRIKYLLKEVDNRSNTGAEPLLSMRMHHGLVVFAEHFSRPPQAATLVGFKIVKPGQFVVNRMQAGNGVIYASNLSFPGLVSPDYAVFEPIAEVNVEYLGELFRSRKVRAKFRSESKGLGTGTSGFLRLYNDRFGAIHVALPPHEEQESILRGLGDDLADFNTAIARTEREIALMQEYRTRLTADVVTGKVDVRAAAAKLPAIADEKEVELDETDETEDLSEES